MVVYPIGTTAACGFAAEELQRNGIAITDHPSPDVTHLLMDVPSTGKAEDLRHILRMLPANLIVVGGNLDILLPSSCGRYDLLKDEFYLWENAAITAQCALQAAMEKLDRIYCGLSVVIIGWGRIGKCLGRLLRHLGAEVTIAARKETDRAMAEALGYRAVEISALPECLPGTELLYNTAPTPVITEDQTIPSGCLILDLASRPGILSSHAISARGLPGRYAPRSSGNLIAKRFLELAKEEEI